MEMTYDDDEDVLSIQLNSQAYWKSIELPNGVVFDMAKDGKITAVEVLRASKVFSGDARKVIELAKEV
jgi:uncharacterized protein YuzE